MFGLDLQLLFAGFANPMVFAIDKGVVVDSGSIVVSTDITLHTRDFISTIWIPAGRVPALMQLRHGNFVGERKVRGDLVTKCRFRCTRSAFSQNGSDGPELLNVELELFCIH